MDAKLTKGANVRVRDVVAHFWRASKRHPVALLLMFGGIGLASIVEVFIPLWYRDFFDTLSSSTDSASVADRSVEIIVVILLLHALLWSLMRIGNFSNAYMQAKTMAILRQQAFDVLLQHSYSFFTSNFTGALVQRVNRYAAAYERLVDRLLYDVVPIFLRVIGTAIVLWHISRPIAYIILAWVALFLSFNYAFSRWKLKYDIERAEADSRTTATLADTITNHNTVQLFSGESAESERFRDVSDRQAKITLFSWNLGMTVDSVQALLTFLAEFALFYFGIKLWVAGTITIGTFVLFQVYLLGLGGKLWQFSRLIRDVFEGFANAKEMVEILDLPREIHDPAEPLPLPKVNGAIQFDTVGFAFSNERMILENFSLSIAPGERVALVGPSGAGKSTIVRLLMRLYDVTSGAVRLDATDIRSLTLNDLRNAIAFVPQDPVLFHRSLLENIRYGKPEATDEEVLAAARAAHCDEFISGLTDGYHTLVGERGIKLSGGERQRVAIARAILKSAPVLILDEATSSLDSRSESLIQDALETLMQGKTVIVIAHRLATIRKLHRILVLDNGAIVEEGTHGELIERDDGLYRTLWELQAGGFLGGGSTGGEV